MQDSSPPPPPLYSHTQLPNIPEQEHLKCPRCDSANTKFCYYNNYNLSQPRHYCRACKRYWTKGGALRKVPVGGGSRKISKRTSSSSAAKNGEVGETLKEQSFGNVKDLGSVLGSNRGGQFGNFVDGMVPIDPGLEISEHFGEPGSGLDVGSRVGLESGGSGGGDGGCWGGGGGGNGWTDLSMYTPGPTFP